MIGEYCVQIARLAIGQQRDVSRIHVVAVVLKPLAAADIFREDEELSRHRIVARGSYTIRKERKLRPRSSRSSHAMQLRHIAEPRIDQHFTLRRIPIEKGSAANLGVSVGLLRN